MTTRAFTLIELLVVIGVIALIIGITIPALSKAREVSRSTGCLSNLRQIGVLTNAYLVDHDGILPTLANRETTADPRPAMDTVFVRPGEATAVFDCPADEQDLFEASGASYFWNFTVNGQRVERIFSIIGGSDSSRVPLASDKAGFHPETKDKVNILYADGHASKELAFSTGLMP